MSAPIVFTADASRQAVEINAWWERHRPAAPGLFREELSETLERISRVPAVAPLYLGSSVPAVRRVLLRSTRVHLYYRFERPVVIVLALWGAAR